MKIISLHIEDFGCFSNRDFDLSRGVNLVSGENESGKSTLISFIKFVLYGMPKKSSETAAFRSRSISWQTGVAAGSMQIETDGKLYTVSRRGVLRVTAKRESYSEECTIVDEALGIEVHKGECPGELFLGVPLSVFESTCFVRQLGSGDIDTDDVSRSLENMLVSADESLNLQKALDKIDSARKLYRHKNGKGGSIPELEAEEASLKTRLSRAMGRYLDGRVSVVFGTHTHVQTADEQVLPGGTAYITDVGMSGPMNGILGVESNIIIQRFLTHMPARFVVADGDVKAHGAIVDVDETTGKATKIQRIVF